MVAAYNRYTVTVPADNGYADLPEEVTDRVLPHIQGLELYADLIQVCGPIWELTTPVLGSDKIVFVLEQHYDFTVTWKDTVYK